MHLYYANCEAWWWCGDDLGLFLSHGTPDLNPIENLWKVIYKCMSCSNIIKQSGPKFVHNNIRD